MVEEYVTVLLPSRRQLLESVTGALQIERFFNAPVTDSRSCLLEGSVTYLLRLDNPVMWSRGERYWLLGVGIG